MNTYSTYLTAVEAYNVGGPALQAEWLKQKEEADRARRTANFTTTCMVAGSLFIFVVTLVAALG